MPNIGTLKTLTLREVFPHEERDFTPWLAANIHLLSEALGIEVEVDSTESRVGDYELDILGRVADTEDLVVIENQLDKTDHSHFGQLLAYAGGLNAKIVVWVAGEVRDEHRAAADGLNQNFAGRVGLYLVRPRALSINGSAPALDFVVEVAPSEFENELSDIVEQSEAPRHRMRLQFWRQYLAYLEVNGHGWAAGRSARPVNWLEFSNGRSGVETNVSMAKESRMRVELYFANDENKRQFDSLFARRSEVERRFSGETLSWERLDHRKASRVAVYRPFDKERVLAEEPVRAELFEWMTKQLLKFRAIAQEMA